MERLQILGLWTEPNPFSEIPRGALAVADNLVIDRPSIAESRRGLTQYADALTGFAKLLEFDSTLMAIDADTFYYDDAGTWTALSGTFDFPSVVHYAKLNKSLYVTTNGGTMRLDAADAPAALSGVAPALDLSASTTGASGFMADNTAVAYRLLWTITNANKRLVLGAPSARAVVTNTTGGTRDISLDFTIPDDITEDHTFQIYRSEQSPDAAVLPSDELQLVYERNPSAGELAAGTITLTDSVLDEDRGAMIYTASTQEGILQENSRPPIAADILEYRQHLFYVNPQWPQELSLSLTADLALNDTIEVNGITYTAKATENVAANEFEVGTSVPATLHSLARIINRSATTDSVYAYNLPGNTLRIAARTVDGAAFVVDGDGIWNRPLPQTSDAPAFEDGIAYSKQSQGDSVPRTNYILAGASTFRRGIALRDVVFFFADTGCYRLTGTDVTNFDIEAHDSTLSILGFETIDQIDNQIFCMTESGPAIVSVNGVDTAVGLPIRQALLEIAKHGNFETLAFGRSYHNDQKYFLNVPLDANDTTVTAQYVFNLNTKTWTRWLIPCLDMLVHENLLYVVKEDEATRVERKSFTEDDYADDEFDVTIASYDGYTVTLTAPSSDVAVGMTLRQDFQDALITAIDGADLTVDKLIYWEATTATAYTPIALSIEWTKDDSQAPGMLKHAARVEFIFNDAHFHEATARMRSNLSSGFTEMTLVNSAIGAWGDGPWGDIPWGGAYQGDRAIPTYMPRESAYGHWFTFGLDLEEAFNAFSVAGIDYEVVSATRSYRG